jgi:hypothetical protein
MKNIRDILFKANLCIILDQNNDLKIIKNRWAGTIDYLNYEVTNEINEKR